MTGWVERWLRPLVVGTMVGCVALAVVEIVRLFVPAWSAVLFFAICVFAAVEAQYSYRLLQSGFQYRTNVWQFRAVECGDLLGLRGGGCG